jgi:hypothetical protein
MYKLVLIAMLVFSVVALTTVIPSTAQAYYYGPSWGYGWSYAYPAYGYSYGCGYSCASPSYRSGYGGFFKGFGFGRSSSRACYRGFYY